VSLAQIATDLFAPVREGMQATEVVLAELTSSEARAVARLFEHASRFGGKRLRPALVHLCGGLAGGTTHEHAVIGAVVEALHMSSLLHDDVLDEADMRRRTPTVNALYGNEIPILLGDLLYSSAFQRAMTLSTLDACRQLAAASVAICRGEIEQSFIRFQTDVDESEYFKVIRDKTATLYGAACHLGGVYAGATEAGADRLRDYGLNLGMAFQIIDDCLDLVGDERIVGKSLGTDLETGKITLPLIRLAQGLSAADRERLQSIVSGEIESSRREALRASFDMEAIVARCHQEADGFVGACTTALEPFPDSPEKRSLLGICEFVLARSY
jgi:octaprenyl-diphosphate synthase